MATRRRRPQRASSRDIVSRWGGEDVVFTDGFLAVPLILLKNLSSLGNYGLSPIEFGFLLQLMTFKWDTRAPHPSYKRIAERMGVSEVYVRKIARALEENNFLKRHPREGMTNEFDLQPLFDILKELGEEIDKQKPEPVDELPF